MESEDEAARILDYVGTAIVDSLPIIKTMVNTGDSEPEVNNLLGALATGILQAECANLDVQLT